MVLAGTDSSLFPKISPQSKRQSLVDGQRQPAVSQGQLGRPPLVDHRRDELITIQAIDAAPIILLAAGCAVRVADDFQTSIADPEDETHQALFRLSRLASPGADDVVQSDSSPDAFRG